MTSYQVLSLPGLPLIWEGGNKPLAGFQLGHQTGGRGLHFTLLTSQGQQNSKVPPSARSLSFLALAWPPADVLGFFSFWQDSEAQIHPPH